MSKKSLWRSKNMNLLVKFESMHSKEINNSKDTANKLNKRIFEMNQRKIKINHL